MTDEELAKLADKSFFQHELTYKVSRDERAYNEGFADGFKAGRDKAKEIIVALLNVFVEDLAEEDLDVGQIDVREKVYRFLEDCK